MAESDEDVLKRLKASEKDEKGKGKSKKESPLRQKMSAPLGISDEGEPFEVPES